MAAEGPEDVVRMRFGCLKVIRHGIVKPSGLVMRYPELRQRGREFVCLGGKSGREHTKIYGGLLTENIVQSLARDIVAEQAMRIKALGYKIATTTHDEVVCVVPDERATGCLECMFRAMQKPCSWCADLPLNATGGIGQNYGGAK
jgi:DNA polymerase